MKLADLDIFCSDTSLLHGQLRGLARHIEPDEVYGAPGIYLWSIGQQLLTGHENRMGFEMRTRIQEPLGDNDGRCGAITRWGALELGQGSIDLRLRVQNLIQRVCSSELCVRVSLGVFMRHPGNFSEIFPFGAISVRIVSIKSRSRPPGVVLIHVLLSGISKVLGISRALVSTESVLHHSRRWTQGTGPIVPYTLDRPWAHLFEADNEDTIGLASFDQSACKMKASRTGGTCIVGVVNRNPRHS